MSNKIFVFNQFPPLLKLYGEPIKALLELQSTQTVIKRLNDWGIDYKDGYVLTENILNHFKEVDINTIVRYKAKTEAAKSIITSR